jgi:glycosyltransferase involved in cell wall biosynthesis
MKISIITTFPFPDGKATANRIKVFADELLKSSYVDSVEVFCCSNDYSSSYLIGNSLRVTNLKVVPIDKNRLVTRAFSELYLAFRLWRQARISHSDLTLVTVPSMLLLVPLILNPRKFRIALDLRDAVWTYFGRGFLPRLAGKLLLMLYKLAAKRSEIISVTNTEEFGQINHVLGYPPLLVSNGISEIKLHEMQSIKQPRPSAVLRLTYIGNVGIAQELDQLIDFSRDIPDLKITIVGDGAQLDILKRKCECQNINNVFFSGLVPAAAVKTYIDSADILFAQIGSKYKTAVPTKVFEYIASGRKVILGLPEGPARKIFSEFYGVEIFEVGSRECFLEAYRRLLRIKITVEFRNNNLDLLKTHYLREKSAKKLVQAIENLNVL